mgnify:CR=1 FL=1
MKRYIILLTTLLATLGAVSQNTNDTINRMVLVESTYNPIIAGAVKRNFIPEEIEPSMKKETIVYADESVPYGEVVKILDLANKHKLKMVLATAPERD